MSVVVKMPICRRIDGRHWYGGRGFQTKEAVIEAMSDRDWRRIVQWEARHAERIASQPNVPGTGGTAA
jgi:hypothetical protein